MQAVCTALFRQFGDASGLFERVESSKVNAANVRTGRIADLECFESDGHEVLVVEVKDQSLTLRHVQDKLSSMRTRGVRERLFLCDRSTYCIATLGGVSSSRCE